MAISHERLTQTEQPADIPETLVQLFSDGADALKPWTELSDNSGPQADAIPVFLVEPLNGMELEMLRLTSLGGTITAMREAFFCSKNSVIHRREVIQRKLVATNMAHAVRRGFELGLFMPGDDAEDVNIFRPAESVALRAASFGLSLAEAARQRGTAPKTIKNNRHEVMTKLNATNMIHAVRIGFEKRILSVADEERFDLF
jgi:DNA-binding NarL/FixJ family response regulator